MNHFLNCDKIVNTQINNDNDHNKFFTEMFNYSNNILIQADMYNDFTKKFNLYKNDDIIRKKLLNGTNITEVEYNKIIGSEIIKMKRVSHISKEPILFTEKDYINLEGDKDVVATTQKKKSSNPFEKSIYDYIDKQIDLTGEKLKNKKFEILNRIINIDTDFNIILFICIHKVTECLA